MLNLYKMPHYRFPEGFLWGSATAGHQIEGGNIHCQRWRMELDNPEVEPSGSACGSWELYREDVKLLRELGHQAYRFSIEWSRIEPENGVHDEAALAKYIDLLELLKAEGIHTGVTLWHFTHPDWFEKLGGFSREENIRYFLRHLNYLVPRIAHLVDSWCIMNEINLGGFGEFDFAVKRVKLKAHGFGAQLVRSFSHAPVSTAHAYVPRVPLRPDDSLDIAAANWQNWHHNDFFFHAVRTGEIVLPGYDVEYVPELKNSCDYWALNYYHRGLVDSRKKTLAAEKLLFNRYPMSLEHSLVREFCPETFVNAMAKVSDKPVWITENGVCADDDRFRIVYLMLQLEAMQEAMRLYHTDIRAYFHWSLLDNYEWGTYKLRFGLVEVDRKTFRRTPKPSASFYHDVIRENGMSGELFSRYLPDFPHYDLCDFEKKSATASVLTQM